MSEWRAIPGYEKYEVSDEGQVRNSKGIILKPQVAKHNMGHLRVQLTGRKRESIHRLVLLAFAGEPPRGYQARHYPDRNPANNRLENLSWGTRKQNEQDKIEQGTYLNGERNHLAKLTWEKVRLLERALGPMRK